MFTSQSLPNTDPHLASNKRARDAPARPRAVAVEGAALAALDNMDTDALKTEWRRLYRSNPPKRMSRHLLLLAVGWKRQERAQGGSSPATRRRLIGMAKTLEEQGDLARPRVVRPKTGARLVREWHGETHTVIVVDDGFEWRGKVYRSLSVIARAITGVRWSGPRFFGLKPKRVTTGATEPRHA